MSDTTLSQISDPLTDAWIEAELLAPNSIPAKEFRITFFTLLEKKLHESGIARCDYKDCEVHT